jgi:hypothetical protein
VDTGFRRKLRSDENLERDADSAENHHALKGAIFHSGTAKAYVNKLIAQCCSALRAVFLLEHDPEKWMPVFG